MVFDIRPVLLGEQELIEPMPASPGQNNRSVQVLSQPLLVNASAQIVDLAQHDSRIAEQSSSPPMSAFRAAFENHAVLKTRSVFRV
jgi:hypothetical protein